MIELRNISKTYKSKKGTKTKALDNVSLKFDDKGMTFILGKSGSGKSTLLNLLGGLDKYDSGDMLVLGKSSKDFSQADFDSYRNTYIGFVFQDFNILEDYNVYENIALALQLQQEKVDSEKINNLLEKLELKELKNRKVNELSGGQKQRVAIARALIKNPRIILADEPTGNLDSTTGKQVMNLLKEISKERLVIIVSHDNESANIYGDRIIEIKDGNVVRDTNTTQSNLVSGSYKTIKSKLPLKESFKLGIGSLKHKKVKLIFTILLTMCTLLFLSVADTLSSYDVEKAHAKLLAENNEKSLMIGKYSFDGYGAHDYTNKTQLQIDSNDEKYIISKLQKPYYSIYKIQESMNYLQLGELLKIENTDGNILYTALGGTFDANIIVSDNIKEVVDEEIIGRIPTNSNEILISNYVADLITIGGITTYESNGNSEFTDNKLFKPKNYEELLNSNKTFYFGSKGKVKIVGIINYDLSKYDKLKNKKYEADKTSQEDLNLQSDLIKHLNKFGNIYVTTDFFNALEVIDVEKLDAKAKIYSMSGNNIELPSDGYYVSPAVINNELEYYNGTDWVKTKKLDKNEVVLNIYQLISGRTDDYKKGLEQYLEKNPDEDKIVLEKKYFENYLKKFDVINKTVNFKIKGYSDKNLGEYNNLKVVGITGIGEFSSENSYYLSKDLVGDYQTVVLQKTGFIVPLTKENDFKTILKLFPYNEEILAESIYSDDVTGLVHTIAILKDIAFWVCVVLLVFTIFLIGNFVITSIHYRKKEIGVLRALGARSTDVIKIFIWEGLTLSIISGTLASILIVLVTDLLNKVIMAGTSLILTPFILGIRQFIVIYLIVFVVTIISSIIPIIRISKMKPIDAILNK